MGRPTLTTQSMLLAFIWLFAMGCHGRNEFEDFQYRVDERALDREERDYVRSYAPILQGIRPAVVSVFSRHVVEAHHTWDHPLSERSGEPPPSLQEGVGSGFVISPRGYVLTNYHVLAGAESIAVLLADGREFDAEVVGTDPQTDVALLRIRADELESAVLADSDQVEVGDIVFAIGNTLGIGHAVTTGIISARGLTDVGILSLENFLQTDASMNVGNSGGPLVDAWGRVIGMNTAIASPGMGSIGVGFAIPINMARTIMEDLVTHGEVRRGFLGIQMRPLSSEAIEQLGNGQSGVQVVDVVPNSPAADAGIRSGDIIVAVDGDAVTAPGDLRQQVALMAPGQRVELMLIRDDVRSVVAAVLGRQP